MRVYLPTTLPGLRSIAATSCVGPGPLTAYAVTPQLREWYVGGDEEELEDAALRQAARAALALLRAAPDARPRRVVLAADVAESATRPVPECGRAAVLIGGPVALSAVASVHVDDVRAEADVAAAAAAVAAADRDDDAAGFVVDAADGHELMWYATQEIPDLLDSVEP